MRHTKGLLTPARALHRALLLELANATTGKTILLPPLSINAAAWPRSYSTIHNTRTLQSPSLLQPCLHAARRPFCSTSYRPYAVSSPKNPRDKDIPYRWVRVADEQGTLSAPQRTESVLANLEEGYSLVMVAPPPPPKSATPTSSTSTTISAAPIIQPPPAAICRIINTVEEAKAAAAAAKEAKQMATHTKTLELNWAIAPHDRAHKMKRLREFLEKGLRVEVMFARKRGSRKATAEEEKGLVDTVRMTVDGVPGAGEYKRMDGRVGGVLRMFFEGPKGKRKGKGKGKKGEEEGEGEEGGEEAV
ncbi:hypothetical protein F5Y07DRAFT_721 [Xylaria sp. FL0933]|nr:hypothetical protein F5Y07DRAFT_721 [Xylaria sp. FL0933]